VAKLEKYRKTPRKRPDWATMMKEIEEGKKLRRVVTNDRSKPILPKSKAKGKFVYDSEKPTTANQILLDIQRGVRLKKTKCNDRSRPILDGLGTFRRQLSTVDTPDTAEPTTPLLEPEEDYDDIDKVRDDLQSTKQLLEIELKNRTKLNCENSKLLEEIRKLTEELKKPNQKVAASASLASSSAALPSFNNHNTTATPYGHSAKQNSAASKRLKSKSFNRIGEDDDADDADDADSSEEEDFGELDAVEDELNALRGQAELARKTAEEFERLYKETAAKLVTTQAEMEDMEHKAVLLHKKLKRAQAPGAAEIPDIANLGMQTDPMELPTPPPLPDYHHVARPNRSMSKRDVRRQMSRQDSHLSTASAANEEVEGEDSEEEEFEQDDEAKAQKRELAMLQSRLRSAKDKERNTRNERIALRLQLRKFRTDLKDERKKYVKLKKEVDGMALMMSEAAEDEDAELVVEEVEVTDSEGEEDEDEENEEDEQEEEDDEEEEDDDIEEVEDVESDERDTESDEMDDRLMKLSERVRNHDNTLNTLKKGNYQLKTRVDSWQEELRKERNRYFSLEQELNTCLAELG